MRISYVTHPGPWFIWDCERMYSPRMCRWVDTDSATWGELKVINHLPVETIHQERRIDAYFDTMTILFNPIELPEVTKVIEAISMPRELNPA
jgi:hypothetical protein